MTDSTIPPFVPDSPRANRIVPFSIYSGENYLSKLERLAQYLRDLKPLLDSALLANDEYFNGQMNALIVAVNNAIAVAKSDVNAALDAHTAELTDSINTLVNEATYALSQRVTTLQQAVDDFLNSQTQVSDLTTRNLVNGPSETRNALNAILDTLESELTAYVNEQRDTRAPLSHSHTPAQIQEGQGTFARSLIPASTISERGALALGTLAQAQAGTETQTAITPKVLADWEAWIRPVRTRAVIIGSSNASSSADSWPTKLGNARSLTLHHQAVGGSGYMTPTDGYLVQAQRAVAALSATQRAATGFVFICDASNDARANRAYSDMYIAAQNVYSYVRANFPNAKIVVIPQIWPSDTQKYAPAAIGGYQEVWNASALRTAQAQEDALRDYRNAVYADQSWTWLTARDELMLANGDVHPGPYGHNVIAAYIERVMDGETIVGSQEWANAVPTQGRTLGGRGRPLAARRDGWLVTVEGSVQSTAGFTSPTDFATLPYGCRPVYGIPLNAKWTTMSTGNPPCELFPNGVVRVYDSGGANTGPIISHTFTLG